MVAVEYSSFSCQLSNLLTLVSAYDADCYRSINHLLRGERDQSPLSLQ